MALIIGGHFRSGTTLTTTLCNQHPEICLTYEFRSFSALNTTLSRYLRRLRKNWYSRGIVRQSSHQTPWWTRLSSAWFVANYTLRLLPFAGHPIGVTEIEQVLHQLFPHARFVGDKTPHYVFELDALTREPDLKRIILYRDGRDVTSSMLTAIRGVWKGRRMAQMLDSVEKIAHSWVRSIEAMEKHQKDVYCLRYEDLARHPRATLDALAKWLEVDPAGFRDDLVRDTSIGKYRTGLTPAELDVVEGVAGPTLARLNYR